MRRFVVSIGIYNGDGLRVSKTADGATCNYLYEYDKIVLEVDGNGAQTGRNIYGMNLLKRISGSDSYSYLYNGHGDVTALITDTGSVAAQYYYDAFGVITEETGSARNPYRYAGYEYDKESGLYYLKARMYDPSIARFLQEDTYRGSAGDPLSLNLYTYCSNEPLMYWDPSGHKELNSQDTRIISNLSAAFARAATNLASSLRTITGAAISMVQAIVNTARTEMDRIHYNAAVIRETGGMTNYIKNDPYVYSTDPSKPPKVNGVISQGEVSTRVGEVQQELIKRGYNLGEWGANGNFGVWTRGAILRFQDDYGLPLTGAIDKKTYDYLMGNIKSTGVVSIRPEEAPIVQQAVTETSGSQLSGMSGNSRQTSRQYYNDLFNGNRTLSPGEIAMGNAFMMTPLYALTGTAEAFWTNVNSALYLLNPFSGTGEEKGNYISTGATMAYDQAKGIVDYTQYVVKEGTEEEQGALAGSIAGGIFFSALAGGGASGFKINPAANFADDLMRNPGSTVVKGSATAGKTVIKNLDDLVTDPKILKNYTPDEMYNLLKTEGYNPTPLTKSKTISNVPFEEGGGFKVNWGGDRILQYHPAGGHHGGQAYWKISSGETGTLRFDLNGNPLPQ